jgi:hypothetical protein
MVFGIAAGAFGVNSERTTGIPFHNAVILPRKLIGDIQKTSWPPRRASAGFLREDFPPGGLYHVFLLRDVSVETALLILLLDNITYFNTILHIGNHF